MAIDYTPQYSLLATVTNVGTFAVQVTSLPALAIGSIVSVSGLTSASVTATNAGIFAVQVTSLPNLAVGSVVSVSGLTSASVTATNEGIFAVQVTSLPNLAVGSIISVSGLTSAWVSVNNLVSTLSTVTNIGTFAVQVTSLPALAIGSILSVSGLTSASVTATNAGTFAVQVTSLPALNITSLPNFAVGSIISISGLTSAIVSISNLPISVLATVTNTGVFAISSLPATVFDYTNSDPIAVRLTDTDGSYVSAGAGTQYTETDTDATIVGTVFMFESDTATSTINPVNNTYPLPVAITSLPAFAIGSIVSVSGLTSAIVSISNLPIAVLATVTNAGVFAVSSLPALNITSLPAFAVGSIVSVSGLSSAIVSISNLPIGVLATVTNAGTFLVQVGANASNWSFTSTYTSAQTNVVLKSEPSSTTAYYITDIIFSNCTTHGNISLIESRPNAAIRAKISDLHFAPYSGAIMEFHNIPIILDTNSALCMTSRSVTAHSITVVGYTK